MTMENMEGDYFVPGTELLENVPKIWKDIQAGFSTCPLKGRSGTVRFQPEGGQERSQQTEGRGFLKNVYQIYIIPNVHLLLPCQKMAQRDQAGMVELLQNCCLMNHVWPLLQGYLGQGTELNSIMAQWKLGNLGCTGFAKTSQRLYFWQDRF